jgi:deoxyribodipyrimidine photo-lyase
MKSTHPLPPSRIRYANSRSPNADGDYVLYWMVAARRTTSNFGLQHALNQALMFNKPLLVLEALRCDYPWASARFHGFVLDGMIDNAHGFAHAGITYYPYVEPKRHAGSGLLEALAARACVVVTDEFPSFFIPKMINAVSGRLACRMMVVDSNGILPLSLAPKVFTTAFSFRRHIHKVILPHLEDMPQRNPLEGTVRQDSAVVPAAVVGRWPRTSLSSMGSDRDVFLSHLPIDQAVGPLQQQGGSHRASELWEDFLSHRLKDYLEHRNQPDRHGTSRLSPYLHFGHISAHAMVSDLLERDEWTPAKVALKPTGSRQGWWGLNSATEAYIDQLITWREVGYTFCHLKPDDHDRFESLPGWAQETLLIHGSDTRPDIYTLEQFEAARTHDPIWNAAQRQLIAEGYIHNYLRMLWGKKILHWTATPQQALAVMTHLNNKYALDGRNPNSCSGIFWTLGRFDRAWGPERAVFGKIRYMSSENTARKMNLKTYLARWGQSQLDI